jgi:hypothetical protein
MRDEMEKKQKQEGVNKRAAAAADKRQDKGPCDDDRCKGGSILSSSSWQHQSHQTVVLDPFEASHTLASSQPATHSFSIHNALSNPRSLQANMADLRVQVLVIVVVFIVGMSITSYIALKYMPRFRSRHTHQKWDVEKDALDVHTLRTSSPPPELHLTPPGGKYIRPLHGSR